MTNKPDVRVPDFQPYNTIRHFLRLIDGQPYDVYKIMRDTLWNRTGTPQAAVDWSDPESWIPEALSGTARDLALRLWRDSDGAVNPRYAHYAFRQCNIHELMASDSAGILTLTPRGRDFVGHEFGPEEQSIDYAEGLLKLLTIVAEQGPGKRSDFLPEFDTFLRQHSNMKSSNVITGAWRTRIFNLLERGLVSREGAIYQITPSGLDYLKVASGQLQQAEESGKAGYYDEMLRLNRQQNTEVRQSIRETLSVMDPYRFEELIKQLLEAIGYENATVTSASGDGGVDVIAEIEVGITSVREVVQVKRFTRSSVGRPVLDQLRGSLHRFSAMRGTIITLGKFSSGAKSASFEPGAPPITLIDGERLISLLIEHRIGVRKRTIEVVDFEPTDFDIDEVNDYTDMGD